MDVHLPAPLAKCSIDWDDCWISSRCFCERGKIAGDRLKGKHTRTRKAGSIAKRGLPMMGANIEDTSRGNPEFLEVAAQIDPNRKPGCLSDVPALILKLPAECCFETHVPSLPHRPLNLPARRGA